MSAPYVGEIRMFSFPRIPTGWFACDGSLKSISDYQVLYTLIGTTYGGDGVQTFGVPDLRGQVPLHQGTGPSLTPRVLGELGGSENVTLLTPNMPAHNHSFTASTAAASTITPGSGVLPGAVTGDTLYLTTVTGANTQAYSPAAVQQQGGNVAHENLMPTLTVSICIAWAGVFPSRN
jgi:microcystin-dependent protein